MGISFRIRTSGLGALVLPLLLGACAREKFLYFSPQRVPEIVNFEKNVKEIKGADAVDMLWVIDNSLSMDDQQRAVIANTKVFMENFSQSSLKWKIGLISTDESEDAYLGFTPNDPLNWTTPDPVAVFQRAVDRLGLNGSGIEKPLQSVQNALRRHTDFPRKGTPFALMVVTDADEQSGLNFNTDFLPEFKRSIGDKDKFFVYEVLNANDLGCDGEDGQAWNYATSAHKDLVTSATIGRVFPMCGPDFGKLMSAIGSEIVQNVTYSTIYLDRRPKPATITVNYKGVPLKAGLKENGGLWTYDFDMNAIVFSDLTFATNATDSVTVNYDVDDGFDK